MRLFHRIIVICRDRTFKGVGVASASAHRAYAIIGRQLFAASLILEILCVLDALGKIVRKPDHSIEGLRALCAAATAKIIFGKIRAGRRRFQKFGRLLLLRKIVFVSGGIFFCAVTARKQQNAKKDHRYYLK
jgi:hypothetical protein